MGSSRPTRRSETLGVRRALANNDLIQVEKSLTSRQRRFCHEYVIDFNRKAAVIRAGYSTAWPARQAANLMLNEGIRRLIDDLKNKKVFEITAVDPNYVIQGIVKITSDPETKDGDRLRGYELLARHLGMFVERQEVTTNAVLNEESKQEAQELVGLLRNLHDRAAQDKKDADIAEEASNVIEFKKA